MAVRSSMAQLIGQARQLIGDLGGPREDFTDQNVQDVLDAHRSEVRYELLRPIPDIVPGQNGVLTAQFVWASYQSQFQYWEADVVIQGLNTTTNQPWVVLTPTSFEYINGKWTFAVTLPNIATPPGQYPPVYAVGKVYDLYATAADLLERRIALRALAMFDVSADGQSVRMSQVIGTFERLRDSYLAKSWSTVLEIERADMAPTNDGGRTPLLTDGQADQHLLPGVLGANVIGTGEGN